MGVDVLVWSLTLPSLESVRIRPTVVCNAACHVLVMKIQASAQNVEQRGLATPTGAHEG